jgi:hypothetical protein
MQFFKGKEELYNYESEDSDQYEPTFRETKPVVEWISDSSFRMGEARSDQPFFDEINVTNETNEKLKYLSVGYGKNELFWIFDLASGASFDLRASPRFKPDGTSNYFLGYGGATWNGRKLEGTMEQKQRKEPSDGPLRFQITITSKDLR